MGFFRKEREQSVARFKEAVESGKTILEDLTKVANKGSTHDPRLIKDGENLTKAERERRSQSD